MTNKIIFTKIIDVSDEYSPKPSSEYLPQWYKKTDSYIGGQKNINLDGSVQETIKKCIPVFDALTVGYIIPTPCELHIKQVDGSPQYITSEAGLINNHDVAQAPYHPNKSIFPYPKWLNPWSIKTPPGYSCLFIPPVHSANNFFTILEGIVDTDSYNVGVNFPFVLNDLKFEGTIPAGTPMVQVIPFKRSDWKMSFGSTNEKEEMNKKIKYLQTRFSDRYKSLFWHKKTYR